MTARRRPPDTCKLTLTIRGVAYALRPIPGGWHLRQESGRAYDVVTTPHGPTCTCADQAFRHEGKDARGCKHIRALLAVGLLEPRDPT